MNFLEFVGVFALALAASLLVMPAVRHLAVARGLLDYPDKGRRRHSEPVPRLGGVAVFVGFSVAAICGALYQAQVGRADPGLLTHTVQTIVCCSILFVIGLADDIRGVPPVVKLAGQTAAALIIQYHWPLISTIGLPADVTINLGWLGVPIGVVWLVGMSNALNLVDGLDGLAGGVALIAIATCVAAAAIMGSPSALIAPAALAGAVLGFLRYNFPPARIFLGDCGSLVLGFLLAVMTVHRATTPNGVVLALVPIFALSYPLLDTGIAILRRWLRGHPLSRADGRHVHHQLQELGLTRTKSLWFIYLYAIGVAALGLSVTFAPPAFTLAVSITGAAVLAPLFIYGIRWLDYHEFLDAGAILASAGTRARDAIRDSIEARDVGRMLERARSLSELDEILQEHARTFRFEHMQVGSLDSVPPTDVAARRNELWKLEYPVVSPEWMSSMVAASNQLVLCIWCARSTTARAASAERVARVLAGAIGNWTVGISAGTQQELRRRTLTPTDLVLPSDGFQEKPSRSPQSRRDIPA